MIQAHTIELLRQRIGMCSLFLLTLISTLQGQGIEKRVEWVGVQNCDAEHFTALLQKKGCVERVVSTDWNRFAEGLKKDKSWWGRMKKKLHLHSQIALDPSIVKIVFMNIPQHLYRDFRMKELPQDKLVLFMWEPRMHMRKMYNKNLHHCFSRVYTWDDDLVDNQRYFKFFYPVLTPMLEKIPSFEEKKLCTLVSGCHTGGKNFSAKYPSELYSERRKAVAFFEEKSEEGFELFGRGWDTAKHPSYRGPISNKIEVIKHYRFSICYENCQHVRGYITEKIFDCFAAGSVPIYWGASNVTDYIPKECFIDRRAFATMEELYHFLKNMTKKEYETYLEHIRKFLRSKQAELFSQETYEKILLEAMTAQ